MYVVKGSADRFILIPTVIELELLPVRRNTYCSFLSDCMLLTNECQQPEPSNRIIIIIGLFNLCEGRCLLFGGGAILSGRHLLEPLSTSLKIPIS